MKLIENWFSERYSDNLQLSFRVRDQLLSVKTDFQRIDVFDTYDFGKLLSIDGTVQLTERDEFVYHEMITRMPYVYSKKVPESVLIMYCWLFPNGNQEVMCVSPYGNSD